MAFGVGNTDMGGVSLPRPASPSTLIADIRSFIATRRRHEIVFAAASVAVVIGTVLAFMHEAEPKPRGPEIIYIQDWAPDRTDADIIAQQKQEAIARAAAQKERQAQFHRLKQALHGIL